jgi:outer membrane protein assembly factor BamB
MHVSPSSFTPSLRMLVAAGVLPALVATLSVAVERPAVAVPAAAATTQTAYQIDIAHAGASAEDVRPPLVEKWSVDFGQPISYPLIVNGTVFVTVRDSEGRGTTLFAMSETDGSVLWHRLIPGTYPWANAAYDNGTVFVVNSNGVLSAYSAARGHLLWSEQLPGQYSFTSAPTAQGGVVYVGGAGTGGTLYAVDEATSAVLWTQGVENGDESSPALSGGRVFVSYACPQTYAFKRATGSLHWRYHGDCEGGGGKTPALYRGRLYVRDDHFGPTSGDILDTRTGDRIGGFTSGPIPAFDRGRGFVLNQGTLQAFTVDGWVLNWGFAGDGGLATAPIVVDHLVYVGSSTGELYALREGSPKVVWKTNVGQPIPAPDEQNVSQPLTGLGAGDGLIVIPTDSTLVAYAPPT